MERQLRWLTWMLDQAALMLVSAYDHETACILRQLAWNPLLIHQILGFVKDYPALGFFRVTQDSIRSCDGWSVLFTEICLIVS